MSKHKLTSVYIAHITWERQFQIYWSQDLDIFAERADGLGFKDKSNSPQNWIAGVANKGHLRFYNHTLPGGPAMVPPPLHWHQQTKRDKSVLTVFPDFKHWILGTNLQIFTVTFLKSSSLILIQALGSVLTNSHK